MTGATGATGEDQDLAAVLRYEQDLLRPGCRADPERLRELLHPAFVEHGASGTVWTRDGVIADLTAAPGPGAVATDLQAHRLAPHVILVTYRIAGSRPSLRSSIWVTGTDGRWQLRFHQGTPAAPR